MRITRLSRVLRFKMFHELRLMLQGVIVGLRTCLWALVLLVVMVFIIALCIQSVMDEDLRENYPELRSLDVTMLTVYRCVSDGCTDNKGQPLQAQLYAVAGKWRSLFFILYFSVTLLVSIGIFNLIMGIFLQCVMNNSEARKKEELADATFRMEARITDMVIESFGDNSTELFSERPRMFRSSVAAVITKRAYDNWVDKPEVVKLLDTIDVDSSSKHDIFDAIDVSGNGCIYADDLVAFFLKLRGPPSKLDVVSARIKASHNNYVLARICDHFGITAE